MQDEGSHLGTWSNSKVCNDVTQTFEGHDGQPGMQRILVASDDRLDISMPVREDGPHIEGYALIIHITTSQDSLRITKPGGDCPRDPD